MHVDPLIPPMVGVIAVILILGILLQVFAALLICFGLAYLTGALGPSSALGAFVGGMIVASAGLTTGIIGGFGYQMTIAVIALSLLFSPGWIAARKWLLITRS